MLGFSHHQISQVLDKLHRIFATAGVYNLVEIWDRRHAQRILLIVSNVFQDINGHSGSYTCDVIHLTQDRFTFDLLLMSVGFLSCFWVNLLKKQIYQTGILFGFFVSILSAFINASIFVKRAKLLTLDSICVTVSFGNVYLFRRYCMHDVYCNRYKCINCSLENVVQREECRCCVEVDRCRERRAEIK